jgi:hypothetical protein
MRVILTYGRAWSALAAARSLGKRGIEVVTATNTTFAPPALSKYSIAKFLYPNPDREPEAFLDTLEAVIRQYKPAEGEDYVLMPVHKEAYLIARHRERFEPLIKLALPSISRSNKSMTREPSGSFASAKDCRSRARSSPRLRRSSGTPAAGFTYPAFVKVRQVRGRGRSEESRRPARKRSRSSTPS